MVGKFYNYYSLQPIINLASVLYLWHSFVYGKRLVFTTNITINKSYWALKIHKLIQIKYFRFSRCSYLHYILLTFYAGISPTISNKYYMTTSLPCAMDYAQSRYNAGMDRKAVITFQASGSLLLLQKIHWFTSTLAIQVTPFLFASMPV